MEEATIAQPVLEELDRLGLSSERIAINPESADTATFCETYGYPVDRSGSTIIVASKKEPKRYAACVARDDTRLAWHVQMKLFGLRIAALLFLALCVSVLSTCRTLSLARTADTGAAVPLGSLALSGPTFGAQTLLPTVCVSGERQFFLGFDLLDKKAGIVTRLVVDPATGPVVRVFNASAPFDSNVLLHRPECRVFHFSLASTRWRINRIQQLSVSLDIDCQLPSGDSIVGKAKDQGCL